MERSDKILVVDDDPAMCELLAAYLGQNGLLVETAGDGQAMRRALAAGLPDAIVMDLMLPGEDGLALIRELRGHSMLPILMLSARGEEVDRVIGLEVGADDYLAKPFSPRELLARLHALLRRSQARAEPPTAESRDLFGPYRIDRLSRRLLRDQTDVELSDAEFDLLLALVERPGRILGRDFLVELLKGYDRDPFDRSIDNRVARLRRKIEPDTQRPIYIRTVRGEGYLFNPKGDRAP